MKKYVIISSDPTPKYFYFTPLVIWAWKKLGWETRMIYVRSEQSEKQGHLEELVSKNIDPDGFWRPKVLREINGFKPETVTQVSRLFGSCFLNPLDPFGNKFRVEPDDFLMTSDIDMLPLSDIWSGHDHGLPVAWGRDLTDYHFPMCYIGMSAKYWHKIMGLKSFFFDDEIRRELESRQDAKSSDKVKRWVTDQNIITERLNEFNKQCKRTSIFPKEFKEGFTTLVPRGTDKRTGYPIGRVDRSHWTLDHKQFIDAHLPHDILTNEKSFHNVMQLLHTVWPKESWTWFINYHKEFKKLL